MTSAEWYAVQMRELTAVKVSLPSAFEAADGEIIATKLGSRCSGRICYLWGLAFICWRECECIQSQHFGEIQWHIRNRIDLEQRRFALFVSERTYERVLPYAKRVHDNYSYSLRVISHICLLIMFLLSVCMIVMSLGYSWQ